MKVLKLISRGAKLDRSARFQSPRGEEVMKVQQKIIDHEGSEFQSPRGEEVMKGFA